MGVKWFDMEAGSDGWLGEPAIVFLYVRRLHSGKWQFVIKLPTIDLDDNKRETRDEAKTAAELRLREWAAGLALEVST